MRHKKVNAWFLIFMFIQILCLHFSGFLLLWSSYDILYLSTQSTTQCNHLNLITLWGESISYSKTSIARVRIARIHRLARCFFSLPFWTHIIVVGAIFTSQNSPKCEFNSHFGQFWRLKMVPTTSSYRSLTVLYFICKCDVTLPIRARK